MWGFIHVQYLVGWGNRLGTMYTWARALYLSKNRGHRIISFQTAGYEVRGQRILVRSVQPRTAPRPGRTRARACSCRRATGTAYHHCVGRPGKVTWCHLTTTGAHVGRPIDVIPLAGRVLEPTRASHESCLGSLRQARSAGCMGSR